MIYGDFKQENTTIEYYNQNADMFINTTIDAYMSALYSEFEKYLSIGYSILNIGCGSWRDSKYFSQKGHSVTSIDASKAMCERTQLIANNVVIQMKAEDIFLNQSLMQSGLVHHYCMFLRKICYKQC